MNDNIKKLVADFYDRSCADNNHRYRSWEHCYSFFLNSELASKNIDTACLQLAFYLASWGMYRGSSFLLWKDYRIHTEVVKKVLTSRALLNFNFTEDEIKDVFKLIEWIKSWYNANIKTVNGEEKIIHATDTLVTKIMLGTLGCIPAYDRYCMFGMRKLGKSYSKLDQSNFKLIIEFYKKNENDFREAEKIIYDKSNIHYPPMKLVDMYFWEIGFQADKSPAIPLPPNK